MINTILDKLSELKIKLHGLYLRKYLIPKHYPKGSFVEDFQSHVCVVVGYHNDSLEVISLDNPSKYGIHWTAAFVPGESDILTRNEAEVRIMGNYPSKEI